MFDFSKQLSVVIIVNFFIGSFSASAQNLYANKIVEYNNGFIDVKSYNNRGNLEGEFFILRKDSSIMYECLYIDGKKEGKSTSYYEDGKIENICFYKEDFLNGLFVEFDKNGDTLKVGEYKNDYKDKEWRNYNKHRLEQIRNYIKGKLNGVCLDYYTNGVVKVESNYIDNNLIGNYNCYYENGNKKIIGSFVIDTASVGGMEYSNLSGVWTYYYENGNVKSFGKFNPKQLHQIERIDLQKNDGASETIVYRLHFFVKDGLWFYYKNDGRFDFSQYYINATVYESDFERAGDLR